METVPEFSPSSKNVSPLKVYFSSVTMKMNPNFFTLKFH